MKVTRGDGLAGQVLDCGGMQVEAVGRFTYLGSELIEEYEVEAEITERKAVGTPMCMVGKQFVVK